jgi:AraC-like DNA-binding protein
VKRRTKRANDSADLGAESSEVGRQFDWHLLRFRLLWCYRNKPTTLKGTFETVNFIIWHLLEGEVEIEAAGVPLKATKGSWIIMIPGLGRRSQNFSPDARIESIHFAVEAGSAQWNGPSAAVFSGDPALSAAAEVLAEFTGRNHPQGLAPGGPILAVSTFDAQLEVQQATWNFWRKLVPHLTTAGISLRAPDLTQPVMAKTMALIESWPMAANWNRREVSRVAGVSASQLDRIWRDTCGQTPFQYWSLRRLLFACAQLQNREKGIKEIAYDLGFAHLSQFSNWFRRRQHSSPRTYRDTFSG